MIWRDHLSDVGQLFSLVDDLQSFWQFKAIEWDKLHRRLVQIHEEEKRSYPAVATLPEERLQEILDQNSDYRTLRDRLRLEIKSALEIAQFLGYKQVMALKRLRFSPPLPSNPSLEAAIEEAESLAHYAQGLSFLKRFLRTLMWLSRGIKKRGLHLSSSPQEMDQGND